MEKFIKHTENTAPHGAADVIAKIKERYGFIPNTAAYVAESPLALEAVLTLSQLFDRASLSAAEREVVLLVVSRANGCRYCSTVHTGLARKAGVTQEVVQAIIDDRAPDDPKLAALRDLARALLQGKGRVPGTLLEGFFAAGFGKAQLFEVVLGVALKTLTNYSSHIAGAEPNPEFVALAGGVVP